MTAADDSKSRVAIEELGRVVTGDLARDVEEIRLHLALLERELPPYVRRRITDDLGGLISHEYGLPPTPEPAAESPVIEL